MTDNMKEFLEKLSKDTENQSRLMKANDDYLQTIIDTAAEMGVALTKEDIALSSEDNEQHDNTLSEEELAAVSGGKYHAVKYGLTLSDCCCIWMGKGDADECQKTCVCVIGGAGELTELGKEKTAAYEIVHTGADSAPVAMWCFHIGWGLP